jgi:catechol 2,3-dioxygenase-like lactoylglutathione lyase family enzyme
MRPHLSLDVRNVPVSVAFYERVFGVPPQKQTGDYAKFDLSEPALNFSLVSSSGKISAVNHLGIEVADAGEVCEWERRLERLGVIEKVEKDVTCCFAKQDKVWFSDPDGNHWEIFHVQAQLAVEGPLASTGCCVSKTTSEAETAGVACSR